MSVGFVFNSLNCRTVFRLERLLGKQLGLCWVEFIFPFGRGYIMRSCIEGTADAVYARYCNFVKVVPLQQSVLMTPQ